MGASAAYYLTQRRVTDVVLVERAPFLGMGSTGRNAGGVRHQFSSQANVKLSIESIHVFEDFKTLVGYDIDFHQHGYLFLLSTEENAESFRHSQEMQRRLGVDVEWLSADEARQLAPGINIEGVLAATFCARDGIADPNGVTMGFAKAAQAAGAQICRDTEVTGIRLENGRVAGVKTVAGTISTPRVVNAAGPYAREIGKMVGLDIPVLPYRRHIFVTQPMPAGRSGARSSGMVKSFDLPASRIMVIDFETTFYFHREGAAILFGMSDVDEASGFDLTVNWQFLEQVIPVATGRLPALAEAEIAHAWAGLYEVTPDAMPIIGPAAEIEGFYLINGFSGHGFQHCPAAGRILADIIVSGRPTDFDISAFALDRFARGDAEPELKVV